MLQPDPENVSGRVDVTIVQCPAVRAFPGSYSKPCDTFRPRRRQSAARRAGLGSPAFVNIDIHRLPPGSFIPQHVSEARPTRIKDGFRQSRLGKAGGAYVADRYQSVLSSNHGRLLMEVVAPSIRNLCVYGSHPLFAAGTLSRSKRSLVAPVVLKSGNATAITERGQLFQAKIYANLAFACGEVIGHFALKRDVPTATSILHERTRFNAAFEVPALPKAKSLFPVRDLIASDLCCAGPERNPTQGTLGAEARSEARTLAMLVPRLGEAPADFIDRFCMDAEQNGATGSQIDEVEASGPTAPPLLSMPGGSHAEVPDLIAGCCVAAKVLVATSYPILEGEHRHARIVAESGGLLNEWCA